MRNPLWLALILPFVLSGLAPNALAQTARPQSAVPVADVPDRTQANFGDWLVRCETQRPQGQPVLRVCEVALTMNDQRGQPIAQIVLGRASRTDPYRMLVQVPLEMRVDQPARVLVDPAAPATEGVSLPFRLCSVSRGGCFAELENIPAALLTRMRARAENQGRLDFREGTGREVQILFSFRGFGQALDALTRETGG